MLTVEIPEKALRKTEERKEKQSKTKPETGFGPSLARLKRSRPYSLWYEEEMKEKERKRESYVRKGVNDSGCKVEKEMNRYQNKVDHEK